MPESSATSSDPELRALVERVLSASYALDREVGRGGMGIVYGAKDRRLKRTVAIKILPPELSFRSEIRTRFLREAETAAQLNHPNIVPIYSVDEREGLVFFVMAFIAGESVGQRLAREGRLGTPETRKVLREVADALAYAHGRGVIHRDIKPDNILIDADSGRVMVTDFGIARAAEADSRLTATGMAIGTPAYMSPEQAVGDRVIDGRSDLYSLGIVAYQMLAGEPPFAAMNTPAMLMKHLSERPVPINQRRGDVPADLAAIVMTLLEKEPERRFPSAQALLLTLDGEQAIPAAPPPRTTPRTSGATTSPAERGLRIGVNIGGEGALLSYDAVPLPGSQSDSYLATGDDRGRWTAAPVQNFRKKFATYAAVNTVIVAAAIVADVDFMFLTVIWSMFMAASYAKLWTMGYDWRDVFRQSRDRRLVDVAQETVEEIRTVFDRNRRSGQRARVGGGMPTPLPLPPPVGAAPRQGPPPEMPLLGSHAETVRQAQRDREEILRQVDSLPKHDRELVNGIIPSSEALYRRIQSLALSLAEMERSSAGVAAEEVESQIARLEAQANPLDRAASEERVRRLAYLKRQRRALADQTRRREEARGKLETCALALRSMRFDVLRLHAGGVSGSLERITLLTERARSLAEDVDAAVYGADEVRRVTRGTRDPALGNRNSAPGAAAPRESQ